MRSTTTGSLSSSIHSITSPHFFSRLRRPMKRGESWRAFTSLAQAANNAGEQCVARSTAGGLRVFDVDFLAIESVCLQLLLAPGSAVSLDVRLIDRRRHEPHGIAPQAMGRVSASDASKPLHWSCAAFVWLALGTRTASRFLNVHLLFLRHHCFRQVKEAEQGRWIGAALGGCVGDAHFDLVG